MTTKASWAAIGDERGSASLEFALAATLLLTIIIGATGFSEAAYQRMRLIAAARAGAQYALTSPTDLPGIAAAARAASDLDAATVTVNASQFCGCADGSDIPCANSCATSTQRRYVSVSVTEPYVLPGSLGSVTLGGTAVIRTR